MIMEKRFSRVIKTLPLIIGFLFPVALSAWVIESSDRKSAPTSYEPSQLTEYIVSNTSGTNYIFENVNKEKDEGNESGFYSNLTTDRTYQNIDGFHRNIYLGYSDGRTLNIDHNVVFTHTQSKIDYSEKEFLEKSTFTPKDGDGDNGTDGSYYVKYFSDKTNATNNTLSYIPKYNKTINYYRNNNSSKPLSYRDYKSDGTYETKTYTPKGYLYTIKLAGNLTIKKGSFLSIGALVLSTNGGGEAGGIIQGNNVELDLNGHTITIEEGATLNAYGYIVDTKVNADGSLKGAIYNHGTIYSPMVVCDYSGGGNTVGRAFAGTVPFSMFNMPYLSAKAYFYNTSKLLCPTALYASSTLSKIVCKIIGNDSDSFIQLEDSSSVLISETKNNRLESQKLFYSGDGKENSITKDGFRTNVTFKGNVKINSLKLSLSMKVVVSIDTSFDLSAFRFPIAPFYSFIIENGAKVICPLTLEFYPGSTLLAKESSQIIFSSTSYDNYYKLRGFSKHSINVGTSYGGIVVPTELPASGNSSYYYSSSYPYSFDSNNFAIYLSNEKELLTNKKPRIRIHGTLKSDLTKSEASKHLLTGFQDIDLSKNRAEISSFKNFSFVRKRFNYVKPSYDYKAVQVKFESPGQSLCGAVSQPLCDSNLNVIDAARIDSKFDSSTTYDYLTGVYSCDQSGKQYICFNEEKKFIEAEEKTESRCVMVQDEEIGTKIRYLYFRNLFVSAENYDNNLFDENGNMATRNADGKYSLTYTCTGRDYDNYFTKGDDDKYTEAKNIGAGDYSVTSTIESSIDYSSFLTEIKNKINSDSKEIDLNGQTFNSGLFKQLSSDVVSANSFGTFKSASFVLVGCPELYTRKLNWGWKYSIYDGPVTAETGDLKMSYYNNFKTRLRFDKNFGSWVKTSNAK